MVIKTKSRLVVFILTFLVWLALTDIKSYQEVLVGIIIALLVTAISGHFLLTTEKSRNLFKRGYYFIIYIFRFFWEMIKANFEVAYLVIHPKVPIKPGIVKIKSKLTKDSALTILSNSITLTPGTLTIDINKDKQELYIHWINVKTDKVEEATESIGSRFEKILMEVFE